MTAPRFATQAIADFALRVGPADLDAYVADRLKRSLLDALGCAWARSTPSRFARSVGWSTTSGARDRPP